MDIQLEGEIRDAILALRFKRAAEGIHPGYFVDLPPGSLRFETTAASFLARFIATHVMRSERDEQESAEDLDKYSSEVLATYLEDQGYIVTSPD